MCCFVCIATLVRLRETCALWRSIAQNKDAWTNALFTYGSEWYQLKDVALADKYMTWTGRVPSLPPTLDTMNNIAFWGTLVDGDRLLATIGPDIITITTDIDIAYACAFEDNDISLLWTSQDVEYTWVDTKTEQEYTKLVFGTKNTFGGTVFSKQCQIKMYAVVKLSSGVGTYDIISGQVEAKEAVFWGSNDAQVDPTQLDFEVEPTNGIGALNVWADSFQFRFFDAHGSKEWFDEYYDAHATRLEMETAFAQSKENAGRGWNSTRRDVLQQIVTQLHKRM
jgi:hypothetical protein